MSSNNKRANTAVLLRQRAEQSNSNNNKQYKMEPVLLTQSWEDFKKHCTELTKGRK
jgi:hypothetical protein